MRYLPLSLPGRRRSTLWPKSLASPTIHRWLDVPPLLVSSGRHALVSVTIACCRLSGASSSWRRPSPVVSPRGYSFPVWFRCSVLSVLLTFIQHDCQISEGRLTFITVRDRPSGLLRLLRFLRLRRLLGLLRHLSPRLPRMCIGSL